MHFAVMAAEAIEWLAVRPEGAYLDATAGLGGHTAEIARRLTTGRTIANDRDAESLEMARRNTAASGSGRSHECACRRVHAVRRSRYRALRAGPPSACRASVSSALFSCRTENCCCGL